MLLNYWLWAWRLSRPGRKYRGQFPLATSVVPRTLGRWSLVSKQSHVIQAAGIPFNSTCKVFSFGAKFCVAGSCWDDFIWLLKKFSFTVESVLILPLSSSPTHNLHTLVIQWEDIKGISKENGMVGLGWQELKFWIMRGQKFTFQKNRLLTNRVDNRFGPSREGRHVCVLFRERKQTNNAWRRRTRLISKVSSDTASSFGGLPTWQEKCRARLRDTVSS